MTGLMYSDLQRLARGLNSLGIPQYVGSYNTALCATTGLRRPNT